MLQVEYNFLNSKCRLDYCDMLDTKEKSSPASTAKTAPVEISPTFLELMKYYCIRQTGVL